jgi:hypothetical protein
MIICQVNNFATWNDAIILPVFVILYCFDIYASIISYLSYLRLEIF